MAALAQLRPRPLLADEARDQLAEALWLAAIQLEDGGLSDALERMRQAQQKLSEAIRNGASPDEIQKLHTLAKKGMALKAIAKALKRSEESTKDRAKADNLSIAKLR